MRPPGAWPLFGSMMRNVNGQRTTPRDHTTERPHRAVPADRARRRARTRFLVLLFVAATALGQSGVPLKERFQTQAASSAIDYYAERQEPYYREVLATMPEPPRSTDVAPVVVAPDAVATTGEGALSTLARVGDRAGDFRLWEFGVDSVEWTFSLQRGGVYEVDLDYYLPTGGSYAAIRSLFVDGEAPFLEAYKVAFYRYYRDEGEPSLNNIGDEVRPRQVEIPGWYTHTLRDSQGFYGRPFRFEFTPGEHTLRLDYVEQDMILGDLTVRPATRLPTYDEVAAGYERRGYGPVDETTKIQAESTVIAKNDPTLRRESEGDPMSEPHAPGYRRLNVMGYWRWRNGDQSLTWRIAVPEDGLYKIGVRLAQYWNDGLPSFRQIRIDGEVPFAELDAYGFAHDTAWQVETLSDESGEPFLFYLEKGDHTLTMSVKMGDLTPVIQGMNDNALQLSRLLRQIIMITGSEPDPNYDYNLDEQIPTLLDDLQFLSDEMQWKVDLLTEIGTKRPAIANNFLTIKSQIDAMIRNPDRIHRKLNDLTNAQTSLGSWYLDVQQLPLVVDYFLFGYPDDRFRVVRSNFLHRVGTTLVNLYTSFFKDYDSVGNVFDPEEEDATLINVWISRGTEWAEIIKELADERFSPDSNVLVNMNVLPPSQLNAGAVNALMLAITSGRAPDVACGVLATSPVEFAIREAVVDLSQFPDHREVLSRFLPGIIEPFRYEGGIYAMPETMDFRVLFYRRDIVDELGLRLPDTWDEIYGSVLPILYQNGMDFYYAIPTELGAIDHNFAPFLYQAGGDFYTEDGLRSALDSPEAYQAFKEYCELYTGYGLPVVANFYNRMRTGEMPMGVGTYDTYMRLSVAAPELAGRWGIAEFPGTRRDDGTVDRTVGGIALEADVILANSEYPDASWEFLKWWTSTPIQERFGRELEALIGPEARWNTANVEAFQRLPWRREDLEVITSTWEWARDMPVVLGGYFTGRHIVNAWNRVVMSKKSSVVNRTNRTYVLPRDSLEQAVKDINRELRQKQEEYGVTAAGVGK